MAAQGDFPRITACGDLTGLLRYGTGGSRVLVGEAMICSPGIAPWAAERRLRVAAPVLGLLNGSPGLPRLTEVQNILEPVTTG